MACHCTIRAMGPRLVVALVPLACIAYGIAAVVTRGAWVSAVAATLVAWFLWHRYGRARFAAYVFLSAVALRSALTGRWPSLAFAIGAILVMQTPPALAAWPRLRPGAVRGGGDRMRRS
jgi:hypothetical protein